jgi:FMN phosphatase YigB (HAD superfamily)
MSPVAPAPKLAVFDLGGVLVRIARSLSEACARAGVPMRGELDHPRAAAIGDDHGCGRIDDRQWAERHAIALPGLYSVDELLKIHAAWLLTEYEGVYSVVSSLRASGVTTACLSNTTESHWRRLIHRDGDEPRKGAPEFPAIASLDRHFASHRLGIAKPDAAAFRAVETAAGAHGAEVLFFDDTRPNVEAARRIGWRAELVDPLGETAPQIARHLSHHGLL